MAWWTGLGSHLILFILMDGPRLRSWAPVRMIPFPGSWVGWVGRGQRAGIPLRFLHVSFLGSWVGYVGRGLGSRWAPFMFPSFWVLCRRLRSLASFNYLQNSFLGSCGGMGKSWPRSWAPVGLPSYLNCFSGLLGRMGGRRPRSWAPVEFLRCQEVGLPLASLHISVFLGSWLGWVGRGDGAGFSLGFMFFF